MSILKKLPVLYDCDKCPAWCCTYEEIEISDKEIQRIADHFKISFTTARRRFTQATEEGDGRSLSIIPDPDPDYFGKACVFLDLGKRFCTIYEVRPQVCRSFPYAKHCGYWDFLKFQRKHALDDKLIAKT